MAKSKKIDQTEAAIQRQIEVERRSAERRKQNTPVATERRGKVQRRRQIDPTTCERDYTDEEVEFMQALDAYKRRSGRMFPTCSEILEVIREIGYVRIHQSGAPASTNAAEVAEVAAV